MTPSEFLTTLWGSPPPGWVLLWTAQNKRSTWFSNFSHVDRFIDAQKKDMDIYTGVSIAPATQRPPGDRVRVSSAQSAGIPGLWADIDIAGLEHQKQGLPQSIEVTMDALASIDHQPSIILHSGHGLQCWWLFDRPWVFKDSHERQLAQQLTMSWHVLLAAEWQKHGWTLDSTYDLARVLRLPGTVNHKSKPVPVKVIQASNFRWRGFPNIKIKEDDLFQRQEVGQSSPAEVGSLDLTPDLMLPPMKQHMIELMRENVATFGATWDKNRQFKGGDDSPSAYDMSIAHWCAGAGFSDQEIAIAIIQWRRLHGYDLDKVMRQDYMQRTIGKVRASNAS